MAVVYIKEQGALVKKADEHLVVEKAGKNLAEIPVHTLSNISVIGNVQVTTQALHLLMREGIDVSYFSYSGNYIGRMASENSKNVFLRFAQYEIYQNLEERLNIAKAIVRNKINNQIAVIKSFRWDNIDYSPKDDVASMHRIQSSLDNKETSNEIMGVEGSCSAVYFGAYGKMFRGDIKFEKRNRRPPRDPVNVILSLGYTLLTKEIASILEAESFEVSLGFLHGIRYGRKSLSLDIVEEFRQPVIDRLTVRLFNKNMMSRFDFEYQEEKIVLTEEGFQKFCKEYEKWMKQPSSQKDSRSFRSIIKAQISHLKEAVKNHTKYLPYEWRNDDVSGVL